MARDQRHLRTRIMVRGLWTLLIRAVALSDRHRFVVERRRNCVDHQDHLGDVRPPRFSAVLSWLNRHIRHLSRGVPWWTKHVRRSSTFISVQIVSRARYKVDTFLGPPRAGASLCR